jgi:hypothetical protein
MTESMERSERVLVKYPLFKTAIARIQACFDSHDAAAEPDCCPIVRESGSGKTTIISFFASLHPRVDHKWGYGSTGAGCESTGTTNREKFRGDTPLSTRRSAMVTRQHREQKHSSAGTPQALPRTPTRTR